MKSINRSDALWSNLSTHALNLSDYQAACCLNVKVNYAPGGGDPEVHFDNQSVPLQVLKDIVNKADQAKAALVPTEETINIPET